MKEHPKLIKLQKKLNNFFTYFKDDNVLVVSEDKATLPFCYAIIDANRPNFLLLSIAVDYPTCINTTEVALKCVSIGPTALTQPFYISTSSGTTFIDQEAYRQWDLDCVDMETLVPISEAIN